MPRQSNRVMDDFILGYGRIRKRGCSSSSSSSSKVYNYRFKRAILVGKSRVGGGSRSSTPAPSWRMSTSSKSKLGGGAVESPKYDGGEGGRTRPVSARKLAATLWEMNEIPSPQNSETRSTRVKEMTMRVKPRKNRPVHTSGSLPPHLSDPSHTPVSERMDRSGIGFRHGRTPSSSRRPVLEDNNSEAFDSLSNSSLMEIETESRAQTPNVAKSRLKDVSNALTTSKELLKIIHRMWGHGNLPASAMSLISALHTELERARLQVNRLIKEQRSNQAETKAVESVTCELKVERKLRRQFENLNKKLGRELAETKHSFAKALNELELAKHQFEEKNALVDKLSRQLEATLERDDGGDFKEEDLGSIELNTDKNKKGFKWVPVYDPQRFSIDNEAKTRTLIDRKPPRQSASIQRSISDGTELGIHENFLASEKQTPRKSHGDDMQRYKSIKGLRDWILAVSRTGFPSPRASKDAGTILVRQRAPAAQTSGSKSQTAGEPMVRRSKR